VYNIGTTMVIENQKSRKLRVGVLRGGPSDEYDVSLRTGQNVIDSLRGRPNYEIQDLLIDRGGVWYIDGLARPFERIFPHVDVIVNALHGKYGEDGRVQQILEAHGVPFTGSKSLGSALGMNKHLAKKFFRSHGLLTPEHVLISKYEYTPQSLQKILFSYPHLRLVKPAASGSSFGICVPKSDAEFDEAIRHAFDFSDQVMVEEFIKGKEATCGVAEGSGRNAHALHPVEIRDLAPRDVKDIWSYESKYDNNLHELVCPGDFTPEQTEIIRQSAVFAHNALGLRHYSRSDFIVNRTGVYILETNTLPGLTNESLFPRSLSVAGITLGDFLDHIITLAIQR